RMEWMRAGDSTPQRIDRSMTLDEARTLWNELQQRGWYRPTDAEIDDHEMTHRKLRETCLREASHALGEIVLGVDLDQGVEAPERPRGAPRQRNAAPPYDCAGTEGTANAGDTTRQFYDNMGRNVGSATTRVERGQVTGTSTTRDGNVTRTAPQGRHLGGP